jgi:hypothetical protein
MEIDADCKDHEREDENEIRAVHRDGNAHAEAEKIRMGHHGKNERTFRIDSKGLSIIAAAPRVSDKAELRIALAAMSSAPKNHQAKTIDSGGKAFAGSKANQPSHRRMGLLKDSAITSR